MKPATIIGVTMKQQIASVKAFVQRNERKILVTTTIVATTGMVIMRTGLKQHDDFLREHGLYDQFYAKDEDE